MAARKIQRTVMRQRSRAAARATSSERGDAHSVLKQERWLRRPEQRRTCAHAYRLRQVAAGSSQDERGVLIMCRWMAWHGQPVVIDEILFKTKHGLVDQSLHSRMGAETTNGDGFGLGWYG